MFFFQFLFNFDTLTKVIRTEWVKLYDYMYIDDTLIAKLKKNYEIYADLISMIHSKASSANSSNSLDNSNSTNDNSTKIKNEKKPKITIPEPFQLTRPKPRKLLEPIAISQTVKFTAIPMGDYEKVNLNKIEEIHREQKKIIYEHVKNKYEGIEVDIAVRKPNKKDEKRKEELLNERAKSINFNMKFVNPPPNFLDVEANIQYNEAAILKEDYFINKKKERKKRRILKE